MGEPSTEALTERLASTEDLGAFLSDLPATPQTLVAYLDELLARHQRTRAQVIRESGINGTFGYQIFAGDRHPSRDYVLLMAFGLGCDLTETQRLLGLADAGRLSPKNPRDAVVMHGLAHGATLAQTEGELYERGLATMGKAD